MGLAVSLGLMGFFAPSALAAFPGGNGLLAVQPLKRSGIVLIKQDGGGARRVCQSGSMCALLGPMGPPPSAHSVALPLRNPHWSPDGRTLVVSAPVIPNQSDVEVIYPDGSCLLNCSSAYVSGAQAAFTSNPTLFTAVFKRQLIEFGMDGVVKKLLLLGRYSDPVWSSRGELAVVRGSSIWVGNPGGLRRLTHGTAPSWSPDGTRIVFARRGWLMTIRVPGAPVRRLVRGTAPAWSPDGRWIAFFGKAHRLSLVRAGGGRVRAVGDVTGETVDWQPLPAKPPSPCLAPPGSAVAAGGDTAIVTFDSAPPSNFVIPGRAFAATGFAWAAMGCLRADGRQRVLALNGVFRFTPNPTEVAVAADYAALVFTSLCGQEFESGWGATVRLFDMRTGAEVPDRGGESVSGGVLGESPSSCNGSMDQLVLGSDAVSAVHTTVRDYGCTCTVEQIQASDSAGVRTLDSVTESDGSPTSLTDLTLTGNTLTWDHDGTLHTAQLHA